MPSESETLAGAAGLDLWQCELCEQKVERAHDYIVGLDGMRVHSSCWYEWKVQDKAAEEGTKG